MKSVVMFSGGLGSWAAAKYAVAKYGKDNVTLLFADTLIEDEDLYRFLRLAAVNVGAPLVMIAEGRTPWQVFEDVRFIGNSRVDPCSRVLKRQILDAWRDKHCSPDDTVITVGLSWYEPGRVEKLLARVAPWIYEAPLAAGPQLEPEDVVAWAVAEGLPIPRLYAMGFSHNNCGGFCVKAGHSSFARLLKHFPERYAHHESEENRLQQKLNGAWSILTDRRGDNKKKPLTLTQFRLRLERDSKAFDPNDEGGCGCAIDA